MTRPCVQVCYLFQKRKSFYSSWKIALERLKEHKDSQCHNKSVLMSDISDTNKILQIRFAERMNHK